MRELGTLFKAVIEACFPFGSEMWVITPCMGGALGCFQNRVALGRLHNWAVCQIIEHQTQRHLGGRWY